MEEEVRREGRGAMGDGSGGGSVAPGSGLGLARGRGAAAATDRSHEGREWGKMWGPSQSNPNKRHLGTIVCWGVLDASNPPVWMF